MDIIILAPFVATLSKFITALSSFWLPAALFAIAVLLVIRAEAIATAMRSFPLVRKLKLYGVEVEIDQKALEGLEERERDVFRKLSRKMERATSRAAQSVFLFEHLRDSAEAIERLREHKFPDVGKDPNVRFTIHVPDAIFENHVYQVIDYYLPNTNGTATGKGRRFSIRYGMIGRCWRTGQSHATASAFTGGDTAIEDLKDKWSMTSAEAESAKARPSCLAISVRREAPKSQLGIVYGDATTANYWGSDDPSASSFAKECEGIGEVKNLRKALTDYCAFLNQIRIDLDLTSL